MRFDILDYLRILADKVPELRDLGKLVGKVLDYNDLTVLCMTSIITTIHLL